MTGGTEAAANKARAEASLRKSQKRLDKSKGSPKAYEFYATERGNNLRLLFNFEDFQCQMIVSHVLVKLIR
jgi:hypothetical protein